MKGTFWSNKNIKTNTFLGKSKFWLDASFIIYTCAVGYNKLYTNFVGHLVQYLVILTDQQTSYKLCRPNTMF